MSALPEIKVTLNGKICVGYIDTGCVFEMCIPQRIAQEIGLRFNVADTGKRTRRKVLVVGGRYNIIDVDESIEVMFLSDSTRGQEKDVSVVCRSSYVISPSSTNRHGGRTSSSSGSIVTNRVIFGMPFFFHCRVHAVLYSTNELHDFAITIMDGDDDPDDIDFRRLVANKDPSVIPLEVMDERMWISTNTRFTSATRVYSSECNHKCLTFMDRLNNTGMIMLDTGCPCTFLAPRSCFEIVSDNTNANTNANANVKGTSREDIYDRDDDTDGYGDDVDANEDINEDEDEDEIRDEESFIKKRRKELLSMFLSTHENMSLFHYSNAPMVVSAHPFKVDIENASGNVTTLSTHVHMMPTALTFASQSSPTTCDVVAGLGLVSLCGFDLYITADGNAYLYRPPQKRRTNYLVPCFRRGFRYDNDRDEYYATTDGLLVPYKGNKTMQKQPIPKHVVYSRLIENSRKLTFNSIHGYRNTLRKLADDMNERLTKMSQLQRSQPFGDVTTVQFNLRDGNNVIFLYTNSTRFRSNERTSRLYQLIALLRGKTMGDSVYSTDAFERMPSSAHWSLFDMQLCWLVSVWPLFNQWMDLCALKPDHLPRPHSMLLYDPATYFIEYVLKYHCVPPTDVRCLFGSSEGNTHLSYLN